jgi:hypothetical protein
MLCRRHRRGRSVGRVSTLFDCTVSEVSREDGTRTVELRVGMAGNLRGAGLRNYVFVWLGVEGTCEV